MHTEHIPYLLRMAECHSINQTARDYFMSPSYMGKILTSIEKEIGFDLFDRNKTGIYLTPEGEKALKKFSKMRELYSDVVNIPVDEENKSLRESLFGTVNFCIPYSIFPSQSMTYVELLTDLFPNLTVLLKEQKQTNTLSILKNSNNSLGFIFPRSESDLQWCENIEAVPIGKKYLSVLMSSNHPLAKNDSLSLAELQDETFVDYNDGCESCVGELSEFIQQYGTFNIKYVMNNLAGFYSILESKLCLSLVFSTDIPEDPFVSVPIRDDISAPRYLAYNKDFFSPLVIQTLLNHINVEDT